MVVLSTKMQFNNKQYYLLVFVTITSLLISFYSGFFLHQKLNQEHDSKVENLSSGKLPIPYFTDQIILITKKPPYKAVYAFATRFSRDWINYTHRQRIYYFDGQEWKEEFDVKTTDNYLIASSSIFSKWDIQDDPSLVLKQSVKIESEIDGSIIELDIPLIENEMGVRSLSSYTIFRSETETTVIIDGQEHEAYVLYDRMYSFNADLRLVARSDSYNISTDWVAFWDEEGNFYNTDETVVSKNQDDPYKSHSIAILKDNLDRVYKSFNVSMFRTEEESYKVNIESDINKEIESKIITSYPRNSKNPEVNNKIGILEGFVKLNNGKSVKGIGFFEYIDQ